MVREVDDAATPDPRAPQQAPDSSATSVRGTAGSGPRGRHASRCRERCRRRASLKHVAFGSADGRQQCGPRPRRHHELEGAGGVEDSVLAGVKPWRESGSPPAPDGVCERHREVARRGGVCRAPPRRSGRRAGVRRVDRRREGDCRRRGDGQLAIAARSRRARKGRCRRCRARIGLPGAEKKKPSPPNEGSG